MYRTHPIGDIVGTTPKKNSSTVAKEKVIHLKKKAGLKINSGIHRVFFGSFFIHFSFFFEIHLAFSGDFVFVHPSSPWTGDCQ